MADNFSVGFDPGSLAKVTRLEGFAALLNPQVQAGMELSAELVQKTAQANTWAVFDNPTGELADSIYVWIAGPEEMDVVVGVPYGRRREMGFEGIYDSLGRGPFHDPGNPYLKPAVDADVSQIQELMALAVLDAWGSI